MWLDGIYIANAKRTEFTKSNKQGRVKVIMFTMMQIAITFRPKDLETMNLIKRAGSKSRPGLVA